jgi:DNA-binding response OmpR family regulator
LKQVVIIEGDQAILGRLQERFAKSFEVFTAADGQDGYYLISAQKPHAVILDLSIGGMSAVALIGKIRAQKKFQNLLFLVLADSLPHELADEAINVGAADAFCKSDPRFVEQVFQNLWDRFKPLSDRRPASSAPAPQSHRLPAPDTGTQNSYSPNSYSPSAKTLMSVSALIPQEEPEPDTNHDEQEQLRTLFADSFGQKVHAIRQSFLLHMTAKDAASQAVHFERFHKSVASLRAEAAQCELSGLVRLLDPLEARARQLKTRLETVPQGSRQAIANAIDLLSSMNNQVSDLAGLNHCSPSALVVEDEAVSRKAITLGLQKGKIRVTAVDSGDAGLRECELSMFDLVMLDVELPGMNGFALCARIRTLPQYKETPILFISALDDLGSRASSKVSGGNQFLTKPVDFVELNLTATTLLLKQRLRQMDRVILSDRRQSNPATLV